MKRLDCGVVMKVMFVVSLASAVGSHEREDAGGQSLWWRLEFFLKTAPCAANERVGEPVLLKGERHGASGCLTTPTAERMLQQAKYLFNPVIDVLPSGMSEYDPAKAPQGEQVSPLQTQKDQPTGWDAWVAALYQWQETCDSTKCSAQNQVELHAKARSWVGSQGGKMWNWLQSKTNDPKNWGRIAWCETERSFVGKLEAKHSMFERASTPDVRDPAAMVHEFLKQRCAWDFGRVVDIDTRLERVSASFEPDQTLDELVDKAPAHLDFTPSGDSDVPVDEIRLQLETAGATEKIWSSLELSQQALLYLWTRDIRLNDVRIQPEHWAAVGLPRGQAARYERRNRLIQTIQEKAFAISRDSLATPWLKAKDVDPLEIRAACGILLKEVLARAEKQDFPEVFRKAVFSAVGQQA